MDCSYLVSICLKPSSLSSGRRNEVTNRDFSQPPLPASPPPPELSERENCAPLEQQQPSCQLVAEEPVMPPLPEGTPPPPDREPSSQAINASPPGNVVLQKGEADGLQQAARQSRWDRGAQQAEAQKNEVLPWLASGGKAEEGEEKELPPWMRSISTVYSKGKNQGEIPVQGGKRFWDGGLPSPFALAAPEEGDNPFPDAEWVSPVEAPGLASPERESEHPAQSYPSPFQLSVQ